MNLKNHLNQFLNRLMYRNQFVNQDLETTTSLV